MAAAALAANSTTAGPAEASGTNWWHSLSQQSKNQLIVDRARQDVGQWGGQCKEWIQGTVVWQASGYHVWLPLNQPPPNDYMWYPDSHTVGRSALLEWTQVGEIIQVRWGSGVPHTAIISGKTSTGVMLIDSNWSNGDGMVREHFLSYSAFYSMLGSSGSFTVYYIL
jgi:hypothetical protein